MLSMPMLMLLPISDLNAGGSITGTDITLGDNTNPGKIEVNNTPERGDGQSSGNVTIGGDKGGISTGDSNGRVDINTDDNPGGITVDMPDRPNMPSGDVTIGGSGNGGTGGISTGNIDINTKGDEGQIVVKDTNPDGTSKDDNDVVIGGGSVNAGNIVINGKDNNGNPTGTITGLTNTTWNPETAQPDRAATEGQLKELANQLSSASGLTIQNGANPGESIAVGGSTTLTIQGDGNTNVAFNTTDKSITMGLKNDVTLGDDANNGSLTVKSQAGDVEISNGGIPAGAVEIQGAQGMVKIGNITIGSAPQTSSHTRAAVVGDVITGLSNTAWDRNNVQADRAATEGQLLDLDNDLQSLSAQVQSTGQNLSELHSGLNKLDNRLNKVGAGAAALAALNPLEFDPDDKLNVSVGLGQYHGQTAGAVGLFFHPDEKVMFSLSGTVGNGENMFNMGASFALDRTRKSLGSRTQMARELLVLRAENSKQNDIIVSQNERLTAQEEKIAKLEAMVESLAARVK